MNTIYLLLLSFLSNRFVSSYGFIHTLSNKLYQLKSHTQTHVKTCFAEDDGDGLGNPKTHQINLPMMEQMDMRNIRETNPLYIVIWKDCKDCKELIRNFKLLNAKYFYFNIDNVNFNDIETVDFQGEDAEDQRKIVERQNSERKIFNRLRDIQNQNEVPIFYKNEKFLGNYLMDIYCELYPM